MSKMKHNQHSQKSLRLKHYDYSQGGGYFVTICTHNRECVLGGLINKEFILSLIGEKAKEFWQEIPMHFENVQLDVFVAMPNHIHGIIIIKDDKNVGVQNFEPLRNKFQHIIPKSLGSIIRTYKSVLTSWCKNNGFANFRWQRNYYEHVIRNEKELKHIREYIQNNPLKWELDRENPKSENFNLDHDSYWSEVYGGQENIY